MNKLYTSILSIAAVAFAASATTRLPLMEMSEFDMNRTSAIRQKNAIPSSINKLSKSPENRADTEIPPIEAIEGEYEWDYISILGGGGTGAGAAQVKITDAETGRVTLTLSKTFTIEGTYADGTLSLAANQYLYYDSNNKIDVYFYHWRWNEGGQGKYATDEPVIATARYVYDDLVELQFDSYDILVIGNDQKGYFLGAYDIDMLPVSEWYDPLMPEEGWEEYSTGTFTDGWQMCAYGVDPAKYPYDVVVEKNTAPEYEGVEFFRIVNPYGPGTPLYKYNTDPDGGKGYILFSLALPDFVMALPLTYSGLEDADGAYLNCNLEGYGYIYGDRLFPDNPAWNTPEIIDYYKLENISNYRNNLVTFYNCVFGTKTEPFTTKTWTDENGSLKFPATLTLPAKGGDDDGVDSVNADYDKTVRYYNLQGVPVVNPDNGIYIKQEGGKTFKVRVIR